MRKILLNVIISLVVSAAVYAASSFTPSLLLENPQPGDPTTNNTWGTKENTGRTLVDNAIGGILTLNLPTQAGFPNVVLASSSGLPDQARNRLFIFTGSLGQTTTVFFPPGLPRFFAVQNNTNSGNLVMAVGTGGSANGTTFTVPASSFPIELYSDGINVNALSAQPSGGVQPTGTAGGDLSGNFPNPQVTSVHLTSPLPSSQGGVPSGTIFYYAGVGAPAGYVLGDGSAQSRTAFASLFAAIGTNYGVGDGVTTFNLPDCRARYIAGGDGGNATGRLTANTAQGISAATLGNTGGEQSHVQTLAELVSHNHPSPNLHDPGHSHSVSGGVTAFGGGASGFTTFASNVSLQTIVINSSTTGITLDANTGSTGSSNPFNLIPPTIIANCIVKTSVEPADVGEAPTALAANDNRDVWRRVG